MRDRITATEAFEKVFTSAKESAAFAKANRVRVYQKHDNGQSEAQLEIRQGDLLVYPCEPFTDEEVQKWAVTNDMQLAVGTTKGARHVMEDASKVTVYNTPEAISNPLVGPRLRVKERTIMDHPTHNLISLAPGDYYIRYQRDLEQERLARVAD